MIRNVDDIHVICVAKMAVNDNRLIRFTKIIYKKRGVCEHSVVSGV